jgi:hypothetical protein
MLCTQGAFRSDRLRGQGFDRSRDIFSTPLAPNDEATAGGWSLKHEMIIGEQKENISTGRKEVELSQLHPK